MSNGVAASPIVGRGVDEDEHADHLPEGQVVGLGGVDEVEEKGGEENVERPSQQVVERGGVEPGTVTLESHVGEGERVTRCA